MTETATDRAAGTFTADGAEQTIDTLIARRAEEIGDPEYESRRWAESLDRYNQGVAQQRREQWARWHRQQAERHRRMLGDLIAHHEAAARQLAGGWW